MEKEAVIRQRDDIIKEHGPWWDAFQLAPDVWTRKDQPVLNPRAVKLVQMINDLAPKPLEQCRILDLGCANGHFSLELALHGAEVLGIEGRQASVKRAEFAQQVFGLNNISLRQDDIKLSIFLL